MNPHGQSLVHSEASNNNNHLGPHVHVVSYREFLPVDHRSVCRLIRKVSRGQRTTCVHVQLVNASDKCGDKREVTPKKKKKKLTVEKAPEIFHQRASASSLGYLAYNNIWI